MQNTICLVMKRMIFFLTITVLLASCLPDYFDFNKISDEIEISPGIAAPIVYGSLTMSDLLQEFDETGYVQKFDDSLLYITYSEELLSYPASEVVNIPDQTFLQFFISSDVDIPAWALSGIGETVTFTKEKSGEFVFTNNERIDSIRLKTTTLTINVSSSFKHTGVLTIYSDNILINGESFEEVIQISDMSGSFTYSTDIGLDNHTLYLDNTNPDTTFLPLRFKLDLTNSGNPISSSESCDITMEFNNIEFEAVFGYLGDYEILLSNGSVQIDLFNEEIAGGKVKFADPQFRLAIENSYGVPVEIELSNVSTYSSIEDVTTPIVFNGVNPFSIEAPLMSQIGDTVVTNIEINKDNCNIDQAIQTSPKYLYYTARARTNPQGPTVRDNFVTSRSNMKADIEVVLPIWINAGGFALEDTTDFNFQEEVGDDVDMVDYFRLTLDATNGLPLDVIMQAYFADENYNIIDSLFREDKLFIAASLDTNGKVSNPQLRSKSVEFTRDRLQSIKETKYLFVRASANTTNWDMDEYVKFYSYYAVDFKVKVKADVTVNSKDF